MPNERDDLFAEVAVERGLLPAEALDDVREAQRAAAGLGMELPLSEVCVSKKLLTKEQVETLREKHSIYIVSNGRINVAGMTPGNLDTLCDAMASVL